MGVWRQGVGWVARPTRVSCINVALVVCSVVSGFLCCFRFLVQADEDLLHHSESLQKAASCRCLRDGSRLGGKNVCGGPEPNLSSVLAILCSDQGNALRHNELKMLQDTVLAMRLSGLV